MSDRPIGLGKVAENGTLNENGAFYSVQDINVLLEEKGSGGDLPTPTVADAGSVVVVGEDGKYALGEAGGGGDLPTPTVADAGSVVVVDEQGKYALGEAGGSGIFIANIFVVPPVDPEVDEPVYYLDKNYSEIKSAFLSNNIVLAVESFTDEDTNHDIVNIGLLSGLEASDGSYSAVFSPGGEYQSSTETGRMEMVF